MPTLFKLLNTSNAHQKSRAELIHSRTHFRPFSRLQSTKPKVQQLCWPSSTTRRYIDSYSCLLHWFSLNCVHIYSRVVLTCTCCLQLLSTTPDLTFITSLQTLARTCAVGDCPVHSDPENANEITFKVSFELCQNTCTCMCTCYAFIITES